LAAASSTTLAGLGPRASCSRRKRCARWRGAGGVDVLRGPLRAAFRGSLARALRAVPAGGGAGLGGFLAALRRGGGGGRSARRARAARDRGPRWGRAACISGASSSRSSAASTARLAGVAAAAAPASSRRELAAGAPVGPGPSYAAAGRARGEDLRGCVGSELEGGEVGENLGEVGGSRELGRISCGGMADDNAARVAVQSSGSGIEPKSVTAVSHPVPSSSFSRLLGEAQ